MRTAGCSDGTYAGLTRVCRQIRAEFRPIQRRETRLQVLSRDAVAYVSTFHATAADSISLPCQLQIGISSFGNRLDNTTFDLLPILKLKVMHQSFDCKFVLSHPGNQENAIFNDVRSHGLTEDDVQRLNTFISNTNTDWMRDIFNGMFSRMRVTGSRQVRIYIEFGFGRAPSGYFENSGVKSSYCHSRSLIRNRFPGLSISEQA
jgi:hypothetical protein